MTILYIAATHVKSEMKRNRNNLFGICLLITDHASFQDALQKLHMRHTSMTYVWVIYSSMRANCLVKSSHTVYQYLKTTLGNIQYNNKYGPIFILLNSHLSWMFFFENHTTGTKHWQLEVHAWDEGCVT